MSKPIQTTTLYRPVGGPELELIRQSGNLRFPPRLFWQPIFYPVLSEQYAAQIASTWNIRDAEAGYVGYVTRFQVRNDLLDRYEIHEASGRDGREYWIPATDLEAFNHAIVGSIEVIAEFRGDPPAEDDVPPSIALNAIVAEQKYPLLFVTISGAHLYGFASPDSDWDLRGVHVLPISQVVGLGQPEETVDAMSVRGRLEIDLVTHDVKKFMRLMLKPNGYVLEQLHSPLIIHTTPEHEELLDIAQGCVTRHHVHHYLGFAANQWKLFRKEDPPRVKPLLYVYRVLLTGIHLMRTGRIEANLKRLNHEFGLNYLDDLIQRKVENTESCRLDGADMAFHENEFHRLETRLKQAGEDSSLPERPTVRDRLNDLLVRLRVKHSPEPE